MEAAALPSPRRALPLATVGGAVALTALGAAAAALTLYVLNAGRPVAGNAEWTVPHLLPTVMFSVVGLLIVRAQPSNGVGWIALVMGLSGALSLLGAEWARRDPSAAGAEWAWWVTTWVFVPGFVAIVALLPLLVPDGRLPSSRWRPVAGLAGLVLVYGTADSMVTPYAESSEAAFSDAYGLTNPIGQAGGLWDVPDAAFFGLFGACILAGLAALAARVRRARAIERQQLKWVLVGLLGLLAGALIGALDARLTAWSVAAGFTALGASMGVAALRHGLWDVEVVLHRGLVYGTLTLSVVGVYALAVALVSDTLGASLLTAVIVATLAEPARRRLQRAAGRIVYGDRGDPAAVAERLSARLAAASEPGALLPDVTATIAQALRLPRVEILSPGERTEGVAIPLLHAGERVGDLVAAPRPGGGLGRADRTALERLAPQVAVAVHAARLTDDLRRSRERLLTAREDERRRLRRDLHDGLGPSLAAFTLQLEAARDLTGTDPDRARELLDGLAGHMRDQVDEVRRIVQDLRPPALDDLGLGEALCQLADRFTGLRVDVTVPASVPALPAAVEAASYRIAAEALANVARHAGAERCMLALTVDGRQLRLVVEDDGRGLGATRNGHGVGLRSMRERADELGGSFQIGPGASGRGCRVEVALDL